MIRNIVLSIPPGLVEKIEIARAAQMAALAGVSRIKYHVGNQDHEPLWEVTRFRISGGEEITFVKTGELETHLLSLVDKAIAEQLQ